MRTKKMILSIILSIIILIVSQILAQIIASLLFVINIPEFICNMLNGILYVVIAFCFIKLLCEKFIKEDMSNYCIPKFQIEVKWIVVAIV